MIKENGMRLKLRTTLVFLHFITLIVSIVFIGFPVLAQQTYTLTIQPDPADALVRIMNIKPRYTAGMKLASGAYDVEVSKDGYFAYREIITLTQDIILPVTLTALTPENV